MKKYKLVTILIIAFVVGTKSVGAISDNEIEMDQRHALHADCWVGQQIEEDVMYVLDDYFQCRENQLIADSYEGENKYLAQKVIENLVTRDTYINTFLRETNLDIVSLKPLYNVFSVTRGEDSKITINLYEWNDVCYRCKGYKTIENMGFGSEHQLLLEKSEKKWKILDDIYDESTSIGASNCNKDTIHDETDIKVEANMEEEEFEPLALVNHYYPGYNTNIAVSYANQWCGTPNVGTQTSIMHSANYNPAYYYVDNADCANFVSQCLHAGGVSYKNNGNYNNGWYAATVTPASSSPQSGGAGTGSLPWIQVSNFDSFWRNYGITRKTGVSYFYIGNPIYWLNPAGSSSTGHLMICTGYNSSGTPLYSAHNGDVNRFPITSVAANHTLYTLLFHCNHSWSSYGSFYKCSRCLSVTNTIPTTD